MNHDQKIEIKSNNNNNERSNKNTKEGKEPRKFRKRNSFSLKESPESMSLIKDDTHSKQLINDNDNNNISTHPLLSIARETLVEKVRSAIDDIGNNYNNDITEAIYIKLNIIQNTNNNEIRRKVKEILHEIENQNVTFMFIFVK